MSSIFSSLHLIKALSDHYQGEFANLDFDCVLLGAI